MAQQLYDPSNSLKGLRTITNITIQDTSCPGQDFYPGTTRAQAISITDDQT